MFGPEGAQPANPGIRVDSIWLPESNSTLAPELDRGWDYAMIVSIIIFFTVVVPMIYFAFKYKRKSDTERTNEVDHHKWLEWAWTFIPMVIVGWLFFVGLRGYVAASVSPKDAMEIQVTAQKWSWTFKYPNGAVTGGELVVPKGKPVRMVMSSTDVLHSFYIAEFRVKNDLIPGQYTTLWFEATKTGETTLQCTEFCGKDHSNMLAVVKVLEPAEFDKWAAEQIKFSASPDMGEKFYNQFGCAACHSLDGTPKPNGGPSFKGLFGRQEKLADGSSVTVDENYLKESINLPQAKMVAGYPPVMPTFQGQLTDAHIDSLILFIKAQK